MDVDASEMARTKMKLKFKNIIREVLLWEIFLTAFCFLLFSGCTDIKLLNKDVEDREEEDRIILNQIEAYQTQAGALKQRIKAKKATFFELTQEVELEDITVEFKPESMTTGTLQAKKGVLYLNKNEEKGIEKNNFFLEGEVTFTNLDGVEMKGSDVFWDSKIGLISKNSFTRKYPIKDTIGISEGNGFLVSPDFTQWTDYGGKLKFQPVIKSNKKEL